MFCPKCGHNNSAEAKFCAKCGTQMLAVASSSTTAANTAGKPAVAEGLKWGIIIGSIFIPLMGIIMGAIYFFDANASAEKKSVGKLWLMTGGGLGLFYVLVLS